LLLLYSNEINILEHLRRSVLTCPDVMNTAIVMQPPGHGLSDVGDLPVLKCEDLTAISQSAG